MAQIRLPASQVAPRRARRFVEDTFPGPALPRLDDAKLLVSELVTNAAIRALSPVELRITQGRSAVRVEVHDHSCTWPIMVDAPPSAERGRGLAIVDRVADRWGVEQVPGNGKAVWFELNT